MENELLIKLKIYLVYLKYFLERYLNVKLNEIYEDSIKKIINSMKKDYFFEKDDFFDIFKYIQFQLKTNNSPTYNELLNSAIFIINKESFIRKNEYFEFVEYLNNILFEDDKVYLIFDYVKKINSIISLDILLEKKDWYHLLKDLNEKISSKNIGETTYKTFINAIFPLISEQKLIRKRKDWFDIVKYFEKSLRNNEEYETLGNILIEIISDKNIKNMNNYDEILKYLIEEFKNNEKSNLYKKLVKIIYPKFIEECFKNNNNLPSKDFIEKFNNEFVQYNYPELKAKYFINAITNFVEKIKSDEYILLYFFEIAQYDLSLSKLLLSDIEYKSFKNIDFYKYEEYLFKRLKNPPYKSIDENVLKKNLNHISLFLSKNIKLNKNNEFIYFCTYPQYSYYKKFIINFSYINFK